jgi:Ca2+-binding EF-hand superfamily protein
VLAAPPAARSKTPPQYGGPKNLSKEQRGLIDMAQSGLNSRFSDMFKAFQYVDLDRSGKVNAKEISRALDLWNIPIDADKLDQIMAGCDHDGDGEITYNEFVDALARDTVAPAAMGKRDMQSLEAMGVPDLDDQFLLKNRQKKFVPTINAKSSVVEERRGAGEVRGSTPQAAPAKRGPAKGGVKAKGGPAPAAPAAPAVKLAVKPAAAAPRQQAPPGPKVLTKEQRGLVDMAQSGLNSRFSDMFKAFQYVDLDRSGKVNKREIARALDLWNIPIDADKLDEIMNACDQDGDGEITYAEFVDALARDTVAPAAMGKRDMQSLEAMGVPDLDDQFLLKNRQKKFVPTMNEKSYVVEERRGADEY